MRAANAGRIFQSTAERSSFCKIVVMYKIETLLKIKCGRIARILLWKNLNIGIELMLKDLNRVKRNYSGELELAKMHRAKLLIHR